MPNRYVGEQHIPMLVNGKIQKGEFAGPGTRVLRRVQMGIKPINMVDLISAIHDVDYYLAQTAKDKKEQREMVVDADKKMVKRLNEVFTKKLDNTLNIVLTSAGIGLKANILDKKDEAEKELMELLKKRKYSAIQKIGKYVLSDKLDNISGPLENYPEKDVSLMKKYKQDTIEEFNKKVNSMSGKGMCGDGIYDIILKILTALFGGRSYEQEDDEEEDERRRQRQEQARREYEERVRPKRKSCEDILAEQNILTPRQFNRWSLRNHPDKLQQRGATKEELEVANEVYAVVSNCVDTLLKGNGNVKTMNGRYRGSIISGNGRHRKVGNVKTMNGRYRGAIIN